MLEILVKRKAHRTIGALRIRTPEKGIDIQQQHHLTHIVCTSHPL
jgi:hypothetical protein